MNLASETGTDDGMIGLTVHNPHKPTVPVITKNTVDNIPIPVVLYAEMDMRRDAPVTGMRNGCEGWCRCVSFAPWRAAEGAFLSSQR